MNDKEKEQLWQELVQASLIYRKLHIKVINTLTREEFLAKLKPIATSHPRFFLDMARTMKDEELKEVFAAILAHSLHPNPSSVDIVEILNLLHRIPRTWLIDNIEKYTQPLLADGYPEDFDSILAIYRGLGAEELINRLIDWGSKHENPEIREFATL